MDPGVTCRIRTVPLGNDLPYSSLSFAWRDQNEGEIIVVNSQLVSVTKSLESPLRRAPHLRDLHPGPEPTFLLWADAIYINQSNARERTARLSLMAMFYQNDECVFAWLGSEDKDDASRALRPVINQINILPSNPIQKKACLPSCRSGNGSQPTQIFPGMTLWSQRIQTSKISPHYSTRLGRPLTIFLPARTGTVLESFKKPCWQGDSFWPAQLRPWTSLTWALSALLSTTYSGVTDVSRL